MDKVKQLLEQRAAIWERAKELVDKAERENRNLTIKEEEEYQKMLDEMDALAQRAKRLEEQEREDRELDKPISTLFKVPLTSELDAKPKGLYRSLFGEPKKSEWKHFGEFAQVVLTNATDSRAIRAAQVEGIGSAGGFVVPDQYVATWLDSALEDEIVRPLATVYPMTTKTAYVPGWDSFDRTGGSLYGGLKLEMVSEGDPAGKQAARVRAIELTAKTGVIYVDVSSELAEDVYIFGRALENALRGAIAYGLDTQFIAGRGGAEALGILNADCAIEVTGTNASNGAVQYEHIVKMFGRMHPAGRRRCVWLANNDLLEKLLNVYIPTTEGNVIFPMQLDGRGGYTMLGRPVIFTDILPAVGEGGDLVLVDFSQYAVGLRREVTLERSNAPGWSERLISFRATIRFDGQPTWPSPLTPQNGQELSPIVKIEPRA